MPNAALLLHILPSGPPHLDWLLPHHAFPPDQPLITFRISRLPTDLPPGVPIQATRIHDHRPLYLEFEGPLSDNRGTVRRLASPRVEMLEETPDDLRFTADWGDGTRTYRARFTPEAGPDRWLITREPTP